MLGHKARDFRPLTVVSLEDLVPEDNFYRQVERSIDLSFVRELAVEFYSNIGRPSVDPVVFFKLQLGASRVHRLRPDGSCSGPQQLEHDR